MKSIIDLLKRSDVALTLNQIQERTGFKKQRITRLLRASQKIGETSIEEVVKKTGAKRRPFRSVPTTKLFYCKSRESQIERWVTVNNLR